MTRMAWLVLVLGGLSSGCGGSDKPAYTPNQQLVAQLGEAGAKDRLLKLFTHAAMPQISKADIEVERDFYFYKGMDHAWVGGFSTVAKPISRKVFFNRITNIEVWDDDDRYYCKLLGIDEDGDEEKLDQLRWTTPQEAREFADLVASFQANLKAPAAPKAEPAAPAAPAPAPAEPAAEAPAEAETPPK